MEKLGLGKILNLKRAFSSSLVTSFKSAVKIIKDVFGSTSNPRVPVRGVSDTSFNSEAYILAIRCMHEIECQKAMVILESRHERWKAGGPL